MLIAVPRARGEFLLVTTPPLNQYLSPAHAGSPKPRQPPSPLDAPVPRARGEFASQRDTAKALGVAKTTISRDLSPEAESELERAGVWRDSGTGPNGPKLSPSVDSEPKSDAAGPNGPTPKALDPTGSEVAKAVKKTTDKEERKEAHGLGSFAARHGKGSRGVSCNDRERSW